MQSDLIFLLVHMITIMLLAISGNLLLIFIIFRGNAAMKRRISPVQLLLLHTCAADLSFALLSLGTEILIILMHPEFKGPDWLCRLIRYLQMFPLYTSPFLLVAISADRFQAICHPFANYRSNRYRRPNCLATIAWISALICSIPQLFVWYKKKNGECATIYGRGVSLLKSAYVISFNTIAWLIPSILAAFFYYKVCKAVWSSRSHPAQRRPVRMSIPTAHLNGQCDRQTSNKQTEFYINRLRGNSCHYRRQVDEFLRKRIQTVRLTMTIIICNFFLWAPFCVANILQAIAPRLLSAQLIIYIIILGNLNSCVNPWIYILFNRNQVKKAFTFMRTNSACCSDFKNRGKLAHITNTNQLLQYISTEI